MRLAGIILHRPPSSFRLCGPGGGGDTMGGLSRPLPARSRARAEAKEDHVRTGAARVQERIRTCAHTGCAHAQRLGRALAARADGVCTVVSARAKVGWSGGTGTVRAGDVVLGVGGRVGRVRLGWGGVATNRQWGPSVRFNQQQPQQQATPVHCVPINPPPANNNNRNRNRNRHLHCHRHHHRHRHRHRYCYRYRNRNPHHHNHQHHHNDNNDSNDNDSHNMS